MASPDGREDPPLIERLREEPEAFDALQAILVLERHAARQGVRAGGGSAPVGGAALPEDEVLHFVGETALAFPVAEVTQVRETPGGPPKVEITFMGMHGPSGVLPQAYSDKVIERQREKDTSLADFLDLFTHRSVSFFIRAWKKYRLTAQVNATLDDLGPMALPSDLGIAGFVDAILGFSTGGLKGRLAPRHTALRFYAGAYAGNPRSAVVLEAILSDYFGERITVDTFVPHWERLPPSEQTQMTPTSFCRLGDEAVIGARVMRPEAKFRIKLGPLDYETLRSFLPDQTRLRELVHLARLFVGEAMFFDIQLILRRDDVPPLQLGDWGGGDGARLGWNTWLTSVAPATNPDDTILSCDVVP